MTEDSEKRGFSGLSSLSSDVGGEEASPRPSGSPASTRSASGENTRTKSDNQNAAQDHRKDKAVEVAAGSTTGRGNRSTGALWVVGLIVGVIVIGAIVSESDNNTVRQTSEPTGGLQSLQYVQPAVGGNNVLSLAQIRWCLRDDLRLDTIRTRVFADDAIDLFNQYVEDYNQRCASYRYVEGNLQRAQQDIASVRSEVVALAIAEAERMESSTATPKAAVGYSERIREIQELLAQLGYEPGVADGLFGRRTSAAIGAFQTDRGQVATGEDYPALLAELRSAVAALSPAPSTTPQASQAPERLETAFGILTQDGNGDVSLTRTTEIPNVEGQKYALFVQVGDIGLVTWTEQITLPSAPATWGDLANEPNVSISSDRRTVTFQASGEPVDGYISSGLSVAKGDPNGQYTIKVTLADGRFAKFLFNLIELPGEFFGRGSNREEVLRLQGTPDAINSYDALGYEIWRYGASTVHISTSSRRVLEWNNAGNLKVQLEPGPNVTKSQTFTRGSHKDDVLRIQGTPTAINSYGELGYEIWRYGVSTINISTSSLRVLEWNNAGNLKVRLEPGPNVTKSPTFTLGSHKDDVLRIQGTPTAINSYSELGFEIWRYGVSTVNISVPNGQVLEWNNAGNLHVRL